MLHVPDAFRKWRHNKQYGLKYTEETYDMLGIVTATSRFELISLFRRSIRLQCLMMTEMLPQEVWLKPQSPVYLDCRFSIPLTILLLMLTVIILNESSEQSVLTWYMNAQTTVRGYGCGLGSVSEINVIIQGSRNFEILIGQ